MYGYNFILLCYMLYENGAQKSLIRVIFLKGVWISRLKDIINPYNCLLKNNNFSVKTTNEV